MKRMYLASLVVALSLFPLASLSLAEDEPVPTEKEVMQAEGVPPLIPHPPYQVKGKEGDGACLVCHEEGIKNAPPTPHAERRGCTQCHVQGEVKKPAGKKRQGSKR